MAVITRLGGIDGSDEATELCRRFGAEGLGGGIPLGGRAAGTPCGNLSGFDGVAKA